MNTADLHYKKMTETRVEKLIISLGIPTTISMLITSIYNLADTYFVGTLGESAQGSIGVLFTLQCVIQAVAFMFGQGAGVFVAKRLADKDVKGASTYVSSSFFLSFLIGVIFLIFGLIFLKPLVLLLGSTDTILPYAKTYGACILVATPFIMGSFVLNNCLRYEGKAFYSMLGLGFGGLLNILVDYLLVVVFDMGVLGAGIATAGSQMISFVLLIVFYNKFAQGVILPKYISKIKSVYFNIIKAGFPSLIRQGLTSVSGGILNNLAKPYGDPTIAAMNIVNKYIGVISYVIIGIGQGFQPVASFNYQSKKYDRVRKSIIFTIAFGVVAGGLLSIPGYFVPELIIRVFQKSSAVIEVGSLALVFASIGVVFMPIAMVTNMLFQSTFQPLKASILSMLRSGVIFIPLVFILEGNFNLLGIQLAYPLADIVTSLITLPVLISYLFKLKKLEENKMQKLVVASGNKGKIKEIKEIFSKYYDIYAMGELGFNEEIEETGSTFYENSLIKAKAVSLALGVDVLADDSGLMVDALNGAPGIYSARYAGEHGNDKQNRDLLLKNLENETNRKARFASSVVLYKTDGTVVDGYGETLGEILTEEQGENGFGYDCIFYSYDLNKSFGLATSEEKNKVSHRYRALVSLKNKLDN